MLFVLPYFNITSVFFFFFNDTATTEIYTLSLHDALPISHAQRAGHRAEPTAARLELAHVPLLRRDVVDVERDPISHRSEEHTSELQSRQYLVCRLLLEKKK